jgi:hypothetical protein
VEIESGISLRDLLFGVISILVAIFAWIGARLHNRQDRLDTRLHEKIDKEEYREELKGLREEVRDSTDRQTKLLIHLFKSLKGE